MTTVPSGSCWFRRALFVNPPYRYYLLNVMATCPKIKVDSGWLTGSGCTYVT
jgi:hypothetical protein